MSSVQAVEFQGPLGTLRGMLHRPAATDPAPVVMLLHGFTGQHIEDQRLFVQFARCLADAGFVVLRFDFYGSGDSDGEFDEFTLRTEVADAAAALDWLAGQPGLDMNRIGVVGLSMGGGVTALLAGQDQRVKAAVFWNAFCKPSNHPDLYETEGPMAGIYGGLRVGRVFQAEMPTLDIPGALHRYQGPGLVIHGTADDIVPGDESGALLAALSTRGTMHLIEGANHTFQHPLWRQEVFGITLRWLAEKL